MTIASQIHTYQQTEGAKTNGVIMGFGGVAAGMTFYLKDGVPVFDYNYFEDHALIKGDKPVPDGEATVELGFNYAGDGQGKGAKVTIKVDGEIKKVVIDVKS